MRVYRERIETGKSHKLHLHVNIYTYTLEVQLNTATEEHRIKNRNITQRLMISSFFCFLIINVDKIACHCKNAVLLNQL